MSDRISNARGGEFATARRGALDSHEIEFITSRRHQGMSGQTIAQMLRRPIEDIRPLLEVLPTGGRRGFQPRRPPVVFAHPVARLPDSDMHELTLSVCRAHDVTLSEMRSARRTNRIAHARMEAMARVFALGTRSNAQIARFFHRDDHTVVIHSRKWWAKREAEAALLAQEAA